MRELILARLEVFRTQSDGHGYNSCRLFGKVVSKKNTVEKILSRGEYPEGYAFNELSDEDLLKVFEKCLRWNSTQM